MTPAAVHPTHTCFDDAIEYLELLCKAGCSPGVVREHVVVHAICCNPDTGKLFAHAWVEMGASAVQAGIIGGVKQYYAIPVADLLTHFGVERCTRYTADEVVEHNFRTGHYGPWLDEYVALCRNAPEVIGKAEVDVEIQLDAEEPSA